MILELLALAGDPALSAGSMERLPGDNAAGVAGMEWVRRVTPSWEIFPEEAARSRIEGDVQLTCISNSDGHARGCTVVSETPEGLGFGEAALSLMPQFQWRIAGGEPGNLGGLSVTFGVPFRYSEPSDLWARVRCRVGPNGRPIGCEAVESSVNNPDVGRAAVDLVEAARLAPRFSDRAAGQSFTTVVTFSPVATP